jgi:murein DD-endopeptidase MepM/ murein hydrolase activator NlpD
MKKSLIVLVILLALIGFFATDIKKEESLLGLVTREEITAPQIQIEPATIYPGDPVFITIISTSTPVSFLWDSKQVPLFTYEKKPRALIAIDFSEKVLKHTVTAQLQSGEVLTKEVTITPRPKIERPLGIPEKLGGNTPKAAESLVKNLANENYILNTVKTATTTLWTKPFQYPVAKVFVTDDYGYNRNTVSQTIVHKGTDFRATVGTEVRAMNRGIVRLARPFTIYGNSVVIDHGLGVQTLYMHLSELKVKEGQTVEVGTLIGKSGDTGYVEAPHLHISVKINSVSIDPMTFMKFFVK